MTEDEKNEPLLQQWQQIKYSLYKIEKSLDNIILSKEIKRQDELIRYRSVLTILAMFIGPVICVAVLHWWRNHGN